MDLSATLGHFLDFAGICITAWVAWKVGILAHQTNSMQEEMQRLARAEGKAEAEDEAERKAK